MSATRDIHVFENGNGGNFAKISNDLVLSESLFQVIYISMFGGNVEASTQGNEIESQERFDYWGNSLIWPNNTEKQFNSETERALTNNVLNSSGRLIIEQAVKNDLEVISQIADFEVEVSITSESKVQINISLSSIPNQSDKFYQFIWDNAKNEVITNEEI